MNRYKIDINLADVFVKNEGHTYDGSFPVKDGIYRGKNSVLFSDLYHLPELQNIYPGAALKVFTTDHKLHFKANIQKIFSWHSLAPKVYRVIELIDKKDILYKAEIVEYIKGEYCFDIIEMKNLSGMIAQVEKEYHIYHNDDLWPSNMINGKWLDFGNFDFNDHPQYVADVAVKYNRFCKWGNNVKSAYQQFNDLGITNGRGDVRKDMFKLDEIDFKDKTVLDIGCSGGYFTNYCSNLGARAIGIDTAEVVQGAREAAAACYHNSEFYPFDFSKEHFVETVRRITGLEKFDYVFFLSMDQHIGFRDDYFKELVGDTLFFESNGGKLVDEEYNEFSCKLQQLFKEVEFKGVSEEGAQRNLFICKKFIGID